MITLAQIKKVNARLRNEAVTRLIWLEQRISDMTSLTPEHIRKQAEAELSYLRLKLRAMELQEEYWTGFADGFEAAVTARTPDRTSEKRELDGSELLGLGQAGPAITPDGVGKYGPGLTSNSTGGVPPFIDRDGRR